MSIALSFCFELRMLLALICFCAVDFVMGKKRTWMRISKNQVLLLRFQGLA